MAASLKKELAFLEFQLKELKGVDQFDTEANVAEAKRKTEEIKKTVREKKEQLREASREAELAQMELANIAEQHFPELPSLHPKLELSKFLPSDRLLLEQRSLGDYSNLELIAVRICIYSLTS